ncbi:MAG: peptide deformylase [Paracoccus sp. (in: a-proteobacteria)]
MSSRLLSYTDPRLYLHAGEAKSEDPLTRVAVRLLDDVLSSASGDQVVAAASLGVPLRLISVKTGEWRHHLFNPRYSAARNVRINWGETSPHTGMMRRNVYRADEIDLIATDMAGQPRQLTLQGQQAIAAQQAFEIFDRTDPFDWITGFHRSWTRASSPMAADRFAALSKGLFEAALPGSEGFDHAAMAFVSQDEVEVRNDLDGREAVARINVNNPIDPVSPQDMEVLSILLGTSMLGQVLFLSRRRFGMAVSALSVVTNLKVHYRPDGWPVQAGNALGFGTVMQPFGKDMAKVDAHKQQQKFDGIVMDADDPYLADLSKPNALSGLAKSLSGLSAPLIISGRERAQRVEDTLLAAFPFVYQMDGRDGGVVYVCLKERLKLEGVYGRLLALENATSMGGMVAAIAQGWHLLTKSGERQPL